MKTVITSTHYKRPYYSADTIAAVAKQPVAKDCHFHASMDPHPSNPVTESIVMEHAKSFASFSMSIREGEPSCNCNTKAALEAALALSPDFVILVEDDVLLGRDALAMFLRQAELHKDNKDIFTVSAWRHPDGWLPGCGREKRDGEENEFATSPWFVPWGWGTWPDRLEEMLAKWTTGSDHSGNENCESWDRVLGLPTGTRGNRVEVQPMISRAINIGDKMGTHRGANILTHWIGSQP